MTSDKTQWVMAPVEPTEEMIRAATKSMNNGSRSGTMKELISQDYKAMIFAAPPAPVEEPIEGLAEALAMYDTTYWKPRKAPREKWAPFDFILEAARRQLARQSGAK